MPGGPRIAEIKLPCFYLRVIPGKKLYQDNIIIDSFANIKITDIRR